MPANHQVSQAHSKDSKQSSCYYFEILLARTDQKVLLKVEHTSYLSVSSRGLRTNSSFPLWQPLTYLKTVIPPSLAFLSTISPPPAFFSLRGTHLSLPRPAAVVCGLLCLLITALLTQEPEGSPSVHGVWPDHPLTSCLNQASSDPAWL